MSIGELKPDPNPLIDDEPDLKDRNDYKEEDGGVSIRVHDVIIKGNTKTKKFLIEDEMESIKSASTLQELHDTARVVSFNLEALEAFDSVKITLDAGPPELPGTRNVIVDV